MKKISAFDMACVVLSVIPWCTLLSFRYYMNHLGYGLAFLGELSLCIIILYVFAFLIFIIIIIYKLIKRPSNRIISVLTIVSYILYILFGITYVLKLISSF